MYQSYAEFYSDIQKICESQINDDKCWLFFFSSSAATYKPILIKASIYERMNNISDAEKLAELGQYLVEKYCENKDLYSGLRKIINKLISIKNNEWDKYYNDLNEYSDIFLSNQVAMNGAMIFTATDIASVMRLHDPIEKHYYNQTKLDRLRCK